MQYRKEKKILKKNENLVFYLWYMYDCRKVFYFYFLKSTIFQKEKKKKNRMVCLFIYIIIEEINNYIYNIYCVMGTHDMSNIRP